MPSAPSAEARARLWSDANAARDQGRIAAALNLYAKATAHAPSHEAAHDAGLFVLEISRNLEAVQDLYHQHYTTFGMPGGGSGSVLGRLLGGDNAEFAIDRLTQANTWPAVPVQWHEELAEALAARGQLRQALHWRRLVHRRDPSRIQNELAIGRLCELLGLLDDAHRQYESMLHRWPDDPEVIFSLTAVQQRMGLPPDEARLRNVFVTAAGGAGNGEGADDLSHIGPAGSAGPATASPELIGGRVLRVVWAAAKRGPKNLPSEATPQLVQLARRLSQRQKDHPTTWLVEGFMAWLAGEHADARQTFIMVSLAMAGGAMLRSDSPPCDAALHDAVNWSRVFVTTPELRRFQGPIPPADPANLNWAFARHVWGTDGILSALLMYADGLRAHHVPAVPLQYEIRGGYKVFHHDGLFYAVPRAVSEFTIIEGRVYRLKGRARTSNSPLPPWLLDLAYRLRARWRAMEKRGGFLAGTIRRVIPIARFVHSNSVRRLAVFAAKLSWRKYTVKGVLVAATPREIFDLIEGQPATS
jgi:tetratricopeptide (TPR) repeat protein